jgi:hypothetical protein
MHAYAADVLLLEIIQLFNSMVNKQKNASSLLHPSGMIYIPLFYAVRPNISDNANLLIHPSGMMTLIHNYKMSMIL